MEQLGPGSIDAVVAFDFFHRLGSRAEVRGVLEKIRRILRTSGRLLVIEPNARYGRWRGIDSPTDGVPLSHRALAEGAAAAGLEVVSVWPRFLPESNRGTLLRMSIDSDWLQMLFGRRLLLEAAAGGTPSSCAATVGARIREGERPLRYFLLLGLILLAGLAARLHNVTAPPNDSIIWRQTQTLMIAQKYYESRLNIFFPQVFWRTMDSVPEHGYVGGTELNVTPFLTALLYYVFGTADWVGRIIPIFFSILGLAYFHRMTHRFCGARAAAFSTSLLCFAPRYLFLGRVQMPESFMFCMMFMAVYYFDRWLERDGCRFFPHAVAACVMMLLAKPQTVFMAMPMVFVVLWRHGVTSVRHVRLYGFLAAVLAPAAAFYFWSFVVVPSRTGIALQGPSILTYGFDMLRHSEFYERIWESTRTGSVGGALTALGIAGLVVPARRRRGWFPHVFLLGAVSSIFMMPGMHYHNNYYQTLFAPPAAMLAAGFLSFLSARRPWAFAALPVVAVAIVQSVQSSGDLFAFHPARGAHYLCGTWIRRHSSTDDRVLVAEQDPSTLYFADRTGWICRTQGDGKPFVFSKELIGRLSALGASIIAVPHAVHFDTYVHARDDAGKLRDYLYDTFLSHRSEEFAVFFVKEPADLTIPATGVIDCTETSCFKYLRGNWGRRYLDRYGRGYVHKDHGPAVIKFVASARTDLLVITLSAEQNSTVATLAINGNPAARHAFSRAWIRDAIPVRLDPPARRGHTVEIQLDVLDPTGAESKRALLWEVEAVGLP